MKSFTKDTDDNTTIENNRREPENSKNNTSKNNASEIKTGCQAKSIADLSQQSISQQNTKR
ncbi:MAG: hypothetical protein QW728_03400, partial [Thermoplasmata archaeon]